MCRNHRGFVDASLAVAKLGADLLYLNTAFAGPQLVDVLEREQPRVVIHDEEFAGLLDAADVEHRRDRLGRRRHRGRCRPSSPHRRATPTPTSSRPDGTPAS